MSKEELIDYQFKFKLNQELYHLYEDYIKKEQDSLSNSVLAKLLKYYEFKYSINKYKLNEYKIHIGNTEKNGRLKIGGYTLEQLKYYKNKCDKIYIPRLENYQLLIDETCRKINTVPAVMENKASVENSAASGTGGSNTSPKQLEKAQQLGVPQPKAPLPPPPTASAGTESSNTSAQPVQESGPPPTASAGAESSNTSAQPVQENGPPQQAATIPSPKSLHDQLQRKLKEREERMKNNESSMTGIANSAKESYTQDTTPSSIGVAEAMRNAFEKFQKPLESDDSSNNDGDSDDFDNDSDYFNDDNQSQTNRPGGR